MAKKGYKLSDVLDICRNLMDHNLADSEHINHVNSQGLHPGELTYIMIFMELTTQRRSSYVLPKFYLDYDH